MKTKISLAGRIVVAIAITQLSQPGVAQCDIQCASVGFFDKYAGRLRFDVVLTTSGASGVYPSFESQETWGMASSSYAGMVNENPVEGQSVGLFRQSVLGECSGAESVSPGSGVGAMDHCTEYKTDRNQTGALTAEPGAGVVVEIAHARVNLVRWKQCKDHIGAGIFTTNSGIGGAFAHAEAIFDDLFPPSDTTTLTISARIEEDGTTCERISLFPKNEKIRACAIISTAGGYAHTSKFTIFNNRIDAGELEMLDHPSEDAGFCWTQSISLSEDAGSTRRLGVGVSIDVFVFTDAIFDFVEDLDPEVVEFNSIDVDWLEANVVGNFDSSSPNYCKSPYWLYRANLVPESGYSYGCMSTSFSSGDQIDAADIAALRMLIDARVFTSMIGDANGDDAVNCGDWRDPSVSSSWTNPVTLDDWAFGEPGYVEALDYDRDGIISTSTFGDRYRHYRNINRADFTGDGVVYDDDFVELVEFYSVIAAGGDLDCDNDTDDQDFVIFAAAYNNYECWNIACP
ncbi:MAG: hypothetical protein JNK16_02020 [Phycisphaerales bacterium]|nr:hypothetical protein [Phycisphaerales bacterium]